MLTLLSVQCVCMCVNMLMTVCVCRDRNLLEYLPDWVCDCRKIEMLDVTHNLLSELPSRLLTYCVTNLFLPELYLLCCIMQIYSGSCNT